MSAEIRTFNLLKPFLSQSLKSFPIKVSELCSNFKMCGNQLGEFVFGFRTGSRGGAVVRALASHQCDPGSIPARCHMWVEFVVGFCSCSEGFSPGSPVFLPPQKPTLQIPISSWMHVHVFTSSRALPCHVGK